MNVSKWCEEGRQKWPHIGLAPDVFASFLAERVESDGDDLAVHDLYLACACCQRDEAAVREFAETFSTDIDKVASRASAPGISAEDARQMLLERILVGSDRSPPKIGSYKGKGSLRSWVRVTAVRLLIDIFRGGGSGRERTVEQSILEEIADSSDPEVAYFKKHYRDQFRAAFEEAARALSSRDRNQLRHLFVDRLTIDQLAALYGIHRSTAARRLAAARTALLDGTRRHLVERVGGSEVDSIMGLIQSRLELSVQRIFAESCGD